MPERSVIEAGVVAAVRNRSLTCNTEQLVNN